MLYDGWDGLGDLTKDNGLYGREVGFTALSETNYKDTDALCLLQAEAAISAGQQVIQEITIDNRGKITDNQVRIFDNLNCIPNSVINPQGETKLYRRLSRIICDPTAPSGESVNPSLAQRYKSIATNDFTLSPITVSAVPADSDAIPLSYTQGAFTKIKGIENRGGLKFHTGNDNILGLEVVGGGGSVTLCSGCGITASKDNDKYVISRNLYLAAAESHNSSLNPDNNNALKIEQSNINGKITYYLYAPNYNFNPCYFCVSGDYVTLNLNAIRTAINSPACC